MIFMLILSRIILANIHFKAANQIKFHLDESFLCQNGLVDILNPFFIYEFAKIRWETLLMEMITELNCAGKEAQCPLSILKSKRFFTSLSSLSIRKTLTKDFFLCNRDLTAPNGDKFNVIL
jgi:hypothetical protein